MRLITPEYFKDFKCIGGKCPDNCCIGWEVRVDSETLGKYDALHSGELCASIRRHLRRADGEAVIEMSEDGRCPFLNKDNLCDLIIALGDSHIPEICREHPRYFTPLGDRVFGGVGLSCDAAARLILSESGAHRYIVDECDGFTEEICDEELLERIALKKQIIIDKLCEKEPSFIDKLSFAIEEISPLCELEGERMVMPRKEDLLELHASLEYLDPAFFDRVRSALSCGPRLDRLTEQMEEYLSRICIYLIDRYLPQAAVFGDVLEKLAVILAQTLAIAHLFLSEGAHELEPCVRLAREYSREIEYNEENVAKIEDAAAELLLRAKAE